MTNGQETLSSQGFARLVDLARGGSLPAQGQLLDAFRPDLLAIAVANLDSGIRPKLSASDLVQETLLEAHRDFGGFRGTTEAEARAWLKSILLHNLVNHFRHWNARRRQANREVPLDGGTGPELRHQLAVAAPTASEIASQREQETRLEQALAHLPADRRQVLELRHRERLSFEAIGKQMNRSSDAARMLWYRAFDELSRRLQ